ncbi:MAG: single-stranded DNA-binding protein, partial [Geminicoccaceae bacterium]
MTDQLASWLSDQAEDRKALSLAKVTIIGTLAEDPHLQSLGGNRNKVGLSVYTLSHWYDSKERCDRTEKQWHRIVITEQSLVAYAMANLTRGDQVYIEGGLHTCYWYDTLYEQRSLTSIIVWQDGHRLTRIDEEPTCDELEIALVLKALDGDTELARPSGDRMPMSYM